MSARREQGEGRWTTRLAGVQAYGGMHQRDLRDKDTSPCKRLCKCTEMRTVRAEWRLAVPLASAACQVGQSCVATRGRLPNHAPAHPNAMAHGLWPANMAPLAQHGRARNIVPHRMQAAGLSWQLSAEMLGTCQGQSSFCWVPKAGPTASPCHSCGVLNNTARRSSRAWPIAGYSPLSHRAGVCA